MDSCSNWTLVALLLLAISPVYDEIMFSDIDGILAIFTVSDERMFSDIDGIVVIWSGSDQPLIHSCLLLKSFILFEYYPLEILA